MNSHPIEEVIERLRARIAGQWRHIEEVETKQQEIFGHDDNEKARRIRVAGDQAAISLNFADVRTLLDSLNTLGGRRDEK